MASEAVRAFHASNMADERRRVELRIANGTKASSPNIISYRRQHPDYKGMPDTSTGSRTTLFFQTTNQRDLPFQKMVGGVIKNFQFAKDLLQQRAASSATIDALKQGLPPQPSPLLQLSDEDSKSLELNALLSSLQDAVEIGNLSQVWVPETKNILRLFSSLLPTFTAAQLGDFQTFFGEIRDALLPDKAPRNITGSDEKAEVSIGQFADKMFQMIQEYAPFIGDTLENKKIIITAMLKKYFKLTPKKLGVVISPAEQRRIDYPFQPPPPAPEDEIAGPQVEEVVDESEGAEGSASAEASGSEATSGRQKVSKDAMEKAFEVITSRIVNEINTSNKTQLKGIYNLVIEGSDPPVSWSIAKIKENIMKRLPELFDNPLGSDFLDVSKYGASDLQLLADNIQLIEEIKSGDYGY